MVQLYVSVIKLSPLRLIIHLPVAYILQMHNTLLIRRNCLTPWLRDSTDTRARKLGRPFNTSSLRYKVQVLRHASSKGGCGKLIQSQVVRLN